MGDNLTKSGRLKDAIYEKGLKPIEVAEKSKISRSLLSKYMNGEREPTPRTAQLMANVLGVNPKWLLGLSDDRYKEERAWISPFEVDENGNKTIHFSELHSNNSKLMELCGGEQLFDNAMNRLIEELSKENEKPLLTKDEELFLDSYRNATESARMEAFMILTKGAKDGKQV